MSRPMVLGGRDMADRVARTCRAGAIACLVALPPVMVVAHRSSLLVLCLGAAFSLGDALATDRGARWRGELLRNAATPLGAAVLAFLAWASISVAWSPSPTLSGRALGEFALPLVATAVLLANPPVVDRRSAALLLGASVSVAAVMILADLATGLAFRRAAGLRPDSFVLNRPALVLVALLPAALWLGGRERAWLLTLVTAALVISAAWRSDSGAARFGLLAMAGAAAVTAVSARWALALATAGLLAGLALAPVMGEVADRTLPARVHGALAASHARDRVDIWLSFGAALREAPVVGQGFGASARPGEAAAGSRIAPEHAAYLSVGHPHSAPLQIWVELGAVGAALAGAVAALLVRRLARLPRPGLIAALPLLAGASAVSLVGQGAWQGWWPAALGAAAVWLKAGGVGESAT